uniref:Uncharacterized protein n=1 Tax=viral metagenome TaxID=1070528 RepID=A0A6M3LC52_9ZZZZ
MNEGVTDMGERIRRPASAWSEAIIAYNPGPGPFDRPGLHRLHCAYGPAEMRLRVKEWVKEFNVRSYSAEVHEGTLNSKVYCYMYGDTRTTSWFRPRGQTHEEET